MQMEFRDDSEDEESCASTNRGAHTKSQRNGPGHPKSKSLDRNAGGALNLTNSTGRSNASGNHMGNKAGSTRYGAQG